MTQTRSLDHARPAERGFSLGFGLFVFGGAGEVVDHSLLAGLPA